ncbi:hypothetical protein EON81_06230 [bacterium]|nr:MAG: hypothetical protein EON81_06230 [bacterium]
MWQMFTPAAKQAVFEAQTAAQGYGQGTVSPDHLVLGLLKADSNTAQRVLVALGVDVQNLRTTVEARQSTSTEEPSRNMTLNPRSKRAIDHAYGESRKLRDKHIGTEHLLLGLIREGTLPLDLEAARQQTPLQQGESTIPAAPIQIFDDSGRRTVDAAAAEAGKRGKSSIGSADLALALLAEEKNPLVGALRAAGIDPARIREDLLKD